ncbi:MAG: FtsX-like permease family protein [Deltaproteobacteria bacterium]|nr:FtsX-like permease family protein [Deltaproteobacteria bacterium]
MRSWIEKQRHLIDFIFHSLGRRKGKNIALVLTFTTLVFFLGSVLFFTQALKKEAARLLQGAPEILVQRQVAGRHDLIPLAYGDKIRNIQGVVSLKPRLWGYYFDPALAANYTLLVPDQTPPAAGDILIGSGISRSRQAFPGDFLVFRNHRGEPVPFLIQGLLDPESELLSSDLILISETDFRKFFGLPPRVFTDLALRVRNPRELATVAFKIVEQLPDTRPIIRDEILRTYQSIFDWRSGIMVFILSAAVLAFFILAFEKASGLSAEEKKEVGILKAVGWETADVLLLKFWEGTILSLSSFLLGFILAYLHVFYASAGLFEPVLKGWAVLYPQFRLTPFIDLYQAAILFFLTVVPYVAATIIPSWRVAVMDPDTVMRT